MHTYMYLCIAIVFEVIATSFLKASNGLSNLWPSVVTLVGYGVAFYFLSMTLKTMPIGVAYALWSGVGIVLTAIVAWVVFKQHLDVAAIIGMALIVAGVVVMNVFSTSVAH